MIKQLDIPFVALKQGIHNFSFEVENAFFEAFPYSIIDEGFISVELSLDKKDTLMVGDYKIFGSVVSTCATCNDVVEVPINGTPTRSMCAGKISKLGLSVLSMTSFGW